MSSPPTFGRMLRQALVLRCPRCGSRRTFIRRWLGKFPRCRTCGIRWHREAGFELGPVALNTTLTFFALAAAMTVAFIITAPDIPVLPLVLTFASVAVGLPILLYPFTYTAWLAFDLAAHPPGAAEEADALAWVAAGSAP
jgi:uncharacterized protein (DUF983 family)